MENYLFDSLFLVNLMLSLRIFLCVLKMYHVWLYIVEKWRFGTAPRGREICSKTQF